MPGTGLPNLNLHHNAANCDAVDALAINVKPSLGGHMLCTTELPTCAAFHLCFAVKAHLTCWLHYIYHDTRQ